MVETKYLIGNICPEGSEQKNMKNPHWGVNVIYMVDEGQGNSINPMITARCMTPCDLEKCKYNGKFEIVEDKKTSKKN